MATAFKNVKNRATTTLNDAGGISDVDTTIIVTDGTVFPAVDFFATIEDEIVLVTTLATNTLTVTRAQQGTTGVAHADGVKIELHVTAQEVIDLQVAINALEDGLATVKFINLRVVEAGTDVGVDTTVGGDFEIPFDGTIIQDDSDPSFLVAYTDTAGVTGTMVVDVHLNGTTIMTTNKLDIETTEKSSSDATTQPDLTTTAVVAGDIITIDVDAIHTTAAKGLTVRIPIRVT